MVCSLQGRLSIPRLGLVSDCCTLVSLRFIVLTGCAASTGLVRLLLLAITAGVVHSQEADGQLYGFVSFSTQRVEVHEDSGNTVTTVQLPLIREVGTRGTIIATVQVEIYTYSLL